MRSVSKKSITKTICSLVDRLEDLYMICHQAPSTHFDELLSGVEISVMEIYALPFSQLLVHAWTSLLFPVC